MEVNNFLRAGTLALPNFAASTPIGAAAATVDNYASIVIAQTTAGISVSLPTPTLAAAGYFLLISNSGTVTILINNNVNIAPDTSILFHWDGNSWNPANRDSGLFPQLTSGVSVAVNLDNLATLFIPNIAAVTVTLSTPTKTNGQRRWLNIKKTTVNAFSITLTPASGTIEGAASYVFNAPLESLRVEWDGTNWWVVS